MRRFTELVNLKKGSNDRQKKSSNELPRHKRDENREIGIITYGFLFIFLALILYVGIFTQTKSRDVINNPYNKRQQLLEERLIRGDIISRNRTILATTIVSDEGAVERFYPYKKVFAHVVGYSTNGVLGIESIDNFKLLECNDNIVTRIKNDLSGKKNHGNTVVTTLDEKIQKAAYEALGDKKGAIIVMNPRNGDILASISKPDFDPNLINEDWEKLNAENSGSPLLNRTYLGKYPPGSTFKIVTALEYIKENYNNYREYDYDCTGRFNYKGSEINCYHGQAHGELDFNLSFAKSCNSSFANIASTLRKAKFKETCNELLFNSELPLPFSYSQGITDITEYSTTDDILQTGIGQGKTLVSPAQLCLITCAIVNNGVLMNPRVVSKIESCSGKTIEKNDVKEYGLLMDEKYADILKELMLDVVSEGTGSKLNKSKKYTAGGKTGSAEYSSSDKSKSHAWFTGFAENEDDIVCVTVIIEDGGTGSDSAVPVAKSVFDAYYE